MSSIKGRFIRMFSKFRLAPACVRAVDEFGGFQLLDLEAELDEWKAGSKVQIVLPSDEVRTYSPIPSESGMTLLGWKRPFGPGARWLRTVRVGDEVPFLGPQPSLELPDGPAIIVGDETSVAVAAALNKERPRGIRAIFQTDAPDDVEAAAEALGLSRFELVGAGGVEATIEAIRKHSSDDLHIGLTGGAELIEPVREALVREGLHNIREETYWSPGRPGLV